MKANNVSDQLAEARMAENWKQWEGQTVAQEFDLREYLGGSDQSAVFLAHCDSRDPQTVAIKLVPENSPYAARQQSSWRLAATVSHPNLTQLLRTGECEIGGDKFLYGLMEYAEENLSQVIAERPLTEDEARDMLKPAVGALAYLHERGLVQGRIKPANIMAMGDQLKVSTDALRPAGEKIEDPGAYDPPEGTSSPAADIWSLGMTLVEALTQRLPASDARPQGDPVLPQALQGPFREVARRCLRRDPNLRWTAADVAKWLNSPGMRATERRSLMRTRNLRSAGIVLVVVFVTLLSLTLLNRPHRHTAKPSPTIDRTSGTRSMGAPHVADTGSSGPKVATPGEPHSSSDSLVNSRSAPQLTSTGAEADGVVHQVLPDVPSKARDTIRGTVRVVIRASVDRSGRVVNATIDSPGPSRYFANLALGAGRQWRFASDRGAASDWTIRFEFTRSGTKASAKRITH